MSVTPKISVPGVAPGEDAALYISSLQDQTVAGAYIQFFIATLGVPPDDQTLVELVRLRNGAAQSCEYCLSVRLPGGHDYGKEMVEKVVHFEDSDLPDRTKAALRLAEAFLVAPSSLTPEARDQALEHFTPEEIVGLMLKLTSFLVNKPRAALGIDGALDPEHLTPISYDAIDDFIPHES